MKVTMKYSLYKKGYSEYRAENYDAVEKTIEVELPEYKKIRFPKEWNKNGNYYRTPNGCNVIYWGNGYGENFLVEHTDKITNKHDSKTVNPGLYARETVIDIVNQY